MSLAVLTDKAARVYKTQGGRYAVLSDATRRIAFVQDDGRRITVYSYTDADFEQLGDPLWTINELIT